MRRGESRQRLIIGILAASGMLTSLQFTLIVPALPDIPAELGVSANDASWMVTATLLTGTAGTPIVTRLADAYGRRRMLLVSLALLVAGSVIAAVGMTFTTVLVGRSLQGFSTAIVPIGISLIRGLTTRERANRGIAFMSGTLGVGSAMGLPLSGVLSTVGGLAALFWFSAGAGLIFVVLVAVFVREVETRVPGRFDLGGAIILGIGLTGTMLVISKVAVWGPGSPAILLLAAVAVLSFAVWFPWELRHPSPVVDVRRSFQRPVLLTNIASFFASFGMFSNHLLTMQEARAPVGTGPGLGIPALGAGLILLPAALVMILLAPLAGKMLNGVGGRPTLALGSAIIGGAFLFRLIAHDGLLPVVLGALMVGVGTAFAFAAMPVLIMDAVPADEAASANGVNSLIRALSGAVAGATLAFLLATFATGADEAYLSDTGLMTAFAIVAAFSIVGTVLALFIPRPDAAFDFSSETVTT